MKVEESAWWPGKSPSALVSEVHALGRHALHSRGPLACSGASSPLSAASTASLRTAVIPAFMETAPSPRASRATRLAATVAFVEARPNITLRSGQENVETAGDYGDEGYVYQALAPLPYFEGRRIYL